MVTHEQLYPQTVTRPRTPSGHAAQRPMNDYTATHRLYTLKYRYVCMTIIPYSMTLNTKPTKIGP